MSHTCPDCNNTLTVHRRCAQVLWTFKVLRKFRPIQKTRNICKHSSFLSITFPTLTPNYVIFLDGSRTIRWDNYVVLRFNTGNWRYTKSSTVPRRYPTLNFNLRRTTCDKRVFYFWESGCCPVRWYKTVMEVRTSRSGCYNGSDWCLLWYLTPLVSGTRTTHRLYTVL